MRGSPCSSRQCFLLSRSFIDLIGDGLVVAGLVGLFTVLAWFSPATSDFSDESAQV
jgi:hypothetical protein